MTSKSKSGKQYEGTIGRKMLKKQFTALGIAALTTIGAIAISTPPSQAQSTTFFCKKSSQGVPTTYARTPQGNVAVIRWVSWRFVDANYSPARRCKEVSGRFQTYYNNGTLDYITTGIINRQSVVCVSSTYGGGCQGLLFTLKRGANASNVIQQLFNIREGTDTTGAVLADLSTEPKTTSINFNDFLNEAPVESSDSTPSVQPEPTSPPSNQPESQPGSGRIW